MRWSIASNDGGWSIASTDGGCDGGANGGGGIGGKGGANGVVSFTSGRETASPTVPERGRDGRTWTIEKFRN